MCVGCKLAIPYSVGRNAFSLAPNNFHFIITENKKTFYFSIGVRILLVINVIHEKKNQQSAKSRLCEGSQVGIGLTE